VAVTRSVHSPHPRSRSARTRCLRSARTRHVRPLPVAPDERERSPRWTARSEPPIDASSRTRSPRAYVPEVPNESSFY
jgi:hypothetical protein